MSGDFRMVYHQTGGPEVIEREALTVPPPGAGEALVRHDAVGLNFIDVYRRAGLYPTPLPSGMGQEGAGIVEAVGEGVQDLAPGDRVAYGMGPIGSYATRRTIPAALLLKLPPEIDATTAAAIMLKGLTTAVLVGPCAKVEAGMSVLVHAAAGGMGSLLVQWLKAIGATVIAHAGSADKAARAQALGADHALSDPLDQLAAQVRERTDGRGVDVVFDGVGAASWAASLAATARRGLVVSYGNASGPVPPVAPLDLLAAGSVFLTRPTMADYLETREALVTAAERLFALITSGRMRVEIGQQFALANAADANRAIEARATTGSTVLLP